MNEFQERLQDLLTENNISRLQLSKIIGITSTTINGYFNNNYYPQINIARKIAQYFNCSLDYLFGLCEVRDIRPINNNSFINNFNSFLKEFNISIARALKDLQMSEYNYYRWKKGIIPKTSNLIDIAKYFGTSIDFLIGNSFNQ